jgi:hypothetical protein
MLSMRYMRGGFISRSRGPSLKVHHGPHQEVTVTVTATVTVTVMVMVTVMVTSWSWYICCSNKDAVRVIPHQLGSLGQAALLVLHKLLLLHMSLQHAFRKWYSFGADMVVVF